MAVAATKKSGNGKPSPKHNIEAVRQAYYDRIAKHDMRPLWKVMDSLVTKEPASRCRPAIWHFDDFKSLVMESGNLISAEEAKRRVLILENPSLRGESRVTR
jgi:gentisate 1,2-dioxygenase